MCGVVGGLSVRNAATLRNDMPRMTAALERRGPDDEGQWCDLDAGIVLGHRRLSIVDTSSGGHQPMVSSSGRFVLTYNGEIYNHLALRKRLEDSGVMPSWRSRCDTETLLECVQAWGLEHTLKQAVGMFALGLWDRRERKLSIARDRFGEKPLYYARQGEDFTFASELSAISRYSFFSAEIDRRSVELLLRFGYIPAPHSIWRDTSKLPPGSILEVSEGGRINGILNYWSISDFEVSKGDGLAGLGEEAVTDRLEKALSDSVRGQMLSDVPLGALLSGGVDSSLVVALMQANSGSAIKTFSIGFRDQEFDETAHAEVVAKHVGSDHTSLYMEASDVLNAVPAMATIYDEPFADSSQLPTSLVMALARKHVTVALTGDGGDEVFGGYHRYRTTQKLWKVMSALPTGMRDVFFDFAMGFGNPGSGFVLPGAFPRSKWVDKFFKLAEKSSGVQDFASFYEAMMTEWGNRRNVVIGADPVEAWRGRAAAIWTTGKSPLKSMMEADIATYLPDDILVKVDRASMAVSLETRAPFLDHRLVQLAWTLPDSYRMRHGEGKWLLKHLLARYLPREIFSRPKKGFSVPLDEWLRGPLRDWSEALLAEDRLRSEGYFDPVPIRNAWKAQMSGTRRYGRRLWPILMFQAWSQRQRELA